MNTLLHMRNNFSGYIRHEGVFFGPGTPSGLMCGILKSIKKSTNDECVHYWWSNYSKEKNKVQLWTKRKKHEWFKYVNVAWGYLRMLRAPFLWCLVQMCQQGNLFVPLFLTSLFWYLSSMIFPFYHSDICGIYLCCQGYLFVPLYIEHIMFPYFFISFLWYLFSMILDVQFPVW